MHLTEEQLILIYYGESVEDPHLEQCDQCRGQLAQIAHLLDRVTEVPVPPPSPGLEDRVCAAIPLPSPPRLVRWPRWAIPAAVAAMLVIAFQIGRHSPAPAPSPTLVVVSPKPSPPASILMTALPEHLERSRIVLAELANSTGGDSLDITVQRVVAEDLVETNRLYRRAAAMTGAARFESLLDDLERILLEVAHAPDRLNAGEADGFRRRIESEGILFRVQLIEAALRNRGLPDSEKPL